jgi:hypothetical protein
MTITISWCRGCGAELISPNTSCELLCKECHGLDDQALVERMARTVRGLCEEVQRWRDEVFEARHSVRDARESLQLALNTMMKQDTDLQELRDVLTLKRQIVAIQGDQLARVQALVDGADGDNDGVVVRALKTALHSYEYGQANV